MAKTVIGLYDDYNSAEKAVDALKDSGVDSDSIHINSHDEAHSSSRYDTTDLHQQLVDEGVPKDDAQLYDEGIRRGGTVVIVEAAGDLAEQVADVMKTHHAVDLEDRRAEWRKEGYGSEEERLEGQGFTAYADAFQEHYRTTYGEGDYGTYEPAYRFGHRYSTLDEYRGRKWEEVEPEVQRKYEAQHGEGTFEDVKEAVRHGFSYPRTAQ